MDNPVALPSPQLVEANRRLHELRAQAQSQRQATGEAPGLRLDEQSSREDLPTSVKDAASVVVAGDQAWPHTSASAHLGWGSDAITAVIHRHRLRESAPVEDGPEWLSNLSLRRDQSGPRVGLGETAVTRSNSAATTTSIPQATILRQAQDRCSTPSAAQLSSTKPGSGQALPSTGWVKLYPDIGLGMLRQELTAPGRLWLMLQYLDKEGSGALRIDTIKLHLTQKSSTPSASLRACTEPAEVTGLRLCGPRQLRNLLQDGEGVYWTRDKEHVWLRSAAKVAYALGVEQLTGRPVALPVAALLDGIGTFRAHLYAAFHSGRTKETPHGTQVMPIARDTLAGLSGVGQSSQRAYEARANVKVQANFAVGEVAKEENRENRAWTQGQALFELKDYRGEQGKKGKTYLAWQLPNRYIGQHQKRPRGRQKRINRKLKDLVMKGMPGNVGETSVAQKSDTSMSSKQDASAAEKREKIYFPNGKLAARAYGRGGRGVRQREMYWSRHRTGNGRFVLWQQLGGSKC